MNILQCNIFAMHSECSFERFVQHSFHLAVSIGEYFFLSLIGTIKSLAIDISIKTVTCRMNR